MTSALRLPAEAGGTDDNDPDGRVACLPGERILDREDLRPSVLDTLWNAAPANTDPLPGQLDDWFATRGEELIGVRRHIHAHPELSGQEFETTKLIDSMLAEVGLQPNVLSKGAGLFCDIGRGDRVVALRADLDALPLPDTKDAPYRSTVANVSHACGHDVHTAILLGAGLVLAQLDAAGHLPGRVRLIFQSSEEQPPSGAADMISAGGLKEVQSIFALHCAPQLPVGLVGVRSGALTAAADLVEISLTGRGGHTARPHMTGDLVHALGRVVVDVPSLLGRRVDPRASASIVFGAVRAGEAANAIPIDGHIRGTVRVLSRDAWRELPELVSQLVHDAVAGTGVKARVNYVRGVPPVINDRAATNVIAAAAAAALGADHVVEADVSMGGEDFAFYVDQVPGAMIRLGVGIPGAAEKLDIHQSTFDVDERAIEHGVRVFVHTALAALSSTSL